MLGNRKRCFISDDCLCNANTRYCTVSIHTVCTSSVFTVDQLCLTSCSRAGHSIDRHCVCDRNYQYLIRSNERFPLSYRPHKKNKNRIPISPLASIIHLSLNPNDHLTRTGLQQPAQTTKARHKKKKKNTKKKVELKKKTLKKQDKVTKQAQFAATFQ